MKTIAFIITGQHIQGSPWSDLVGNTKNYVKATFSFDSTWDNMLKVAIFTANSKQYPVIIENNECIVPGIAMSGEFFDVGVYGGAGSTRLTTDTARVRVEESVRQKPPFDMIKMYEDLNDRMDDIESDEETIETALTGKQDKTLAVPIVVGETTCTTVEEVLNALANQEILFDEALSGTSENAVQNKVVKAKFDAVDGAVELNTTHRQGKATSVNGSHGFRVDPTTHKPQYYDETEEEWVNTAGSIDVDSALSNSSENPVQNKVIKSKIDTMDAAIANNTAHASQKMSDQSGAHGLRVEQTSKKVQYYDATNEEWEDAKSVVDIDSALSDVSENPVQNKKVKEAIDDINDKSVNDTAGAFGFRVNQSTKRGQYFNESTEVWENIEDSGGGGGTVTVDDQFSTLSENPVQNKVITNKINSMDTAIAASTTHDATGITESGGVHGLRVNSSEKVQYYDTNDDEWKDTASGIVIDSALSGTSENPVQNKKVKEAIDNHTEGSVTDTNGVHGFRVNSSTFKGQYYDETAQEWKDLAGGSGGGVEVGDVSSFSATKSFRTATLTWVDPTDFVVDGRTIAAWDKTVIVRKAGSVPTSASDGTVVVTETTRNQYSSTGFTDTGLSYGLVYYYRAFVYTTQEVETKGSSISVTPERGVISFVPTQTSQFTYDGTEKSVSFSDGDKIDVTGSVTGTNAGSYAVSFVPKEDWEWSDGIQESEGISARGTLVSAWSIAKANAQATLSSNSVTLNADNLSDTVTVSNASGTVTVSSGDTSIATASISNDTITISSVDGTNGTVDITVSIAASANYNAGTKTISVSCEFTTIYGVVWDGSAASNMTRTDDAVGFTNPSPAVNNGSGSSPFDDIAPWSEMTVVDDANAGKLVKIPKFYYKRTITGSTYKLQISMTQEEGFSVSPAHRDRGNGEKDIIYVGRYHCASNYKSQSGGAPAANYTRSEFRTSIHNLGSDIWQWDYSVWQTIHMLYLVEFADWDSQKTIGKGCSAGSAVFNMGATDNMNYHTGTDQASRDSYGCTQYRNIEGLWDNVYDWCDGIYFSSTNIYIIDNPANFSDSSGGVLVGTRPSATGWIKAFAKSNVTGYDWFEYCSDKDGAEGSYVCDRCYYNASGVVLYVGGCYGQDALFGLFFAYGNYAATDKSAYVGSRLMKIP